MTFFSYYCIFFGICFLAVITKATIKTIRIEYSGYFLKVFTQLSVFYGVFLMPILLVGVWLAYSQSLVNLACSIGISAFALLYIYARLIEPKNLKVMYNDITISTEQAQLSKPVKIALLADLHVGLFDMYPKQLDKIVAKVNALEDIDAVVIAGDWTYEPEPNLYKQLKHIGNIKYPCYHVLGNHDEECPGPVISAKLLSALTKIGIKDIEGAHVDLGGLNLVGVGDLWANKVDFSFDVNEINTKPCVILAHNPDTVIHIPENMFASRPLMLSGHTHGGQIHIPKLVPWLFKRHSETGYCVGLYQHQNAQVFVTAGLGMVDMPFRINMPPRIDVLTLS